MALADPGPLLFEPILKHRAWGGHALAAMGKRPTGGVHPPFGESWELADLPLTIEGGRSIVRQGPWAGQSLRKVINTERDTILGLARPAQDGGFPLLVKFLDAAENLSIQVHPDAAYARRHPGALVKSEAWIVLQAAPGAVVYRGIDPALSRDDVAQLLDEDRVLEALLKVPVRAGDCVRLPSGLCHALGAGIVAAEVQTPSDTTFRLWDWGRHDPKRPLHRTEALECLLIGAAQELDSTGHALPRESSDSTAAGSPRESGSFSGNPLRAGAFTTEDLCRTPDFEIERISVSADRREGERAQQSSDGRRGTSDTTGQADRREHEREGHRDLQSKEITLPIVNDGLPVIWIMLAGRARFDRDREHPSAQTEVVPFDTLLLPAGCEGWSASLEPGTCFLRVTLPHPMSRMLAAHG